ncbi:multidrug effflux MFS transporter [Piscirickettsia litoralis]|uniref:Bcr/CflA family efflux transporter n=1 Tax=Piscirickettsia litoralis TaxID=1891921 RepID=A0ABX3A2I7_9GAMM|nr:multidrug effflux MFS transporter [Piscirickettsia litoralis]ODN43077.1 hypothetical protein BGC07_09320 [Piscirickettsia litoralis]
MSIWVACSEVRKPINETLFLIGIFIVMAVGPFLSDMYLPSLPAMVQYFGSSHAMIQNSLSLYLAGFAVAQLFYGPLSDGFGRRRALLVGAGVCLVGTLLTLQAETVSVLLLGRFIQGLGAAAFPAISRAAMSDMYQGTRLAKMGSYTALVFSAVAAGAPILGGVIQHYFDWRVNFVVLGLFVLLILLIVLFVLPETHFKRTENALSPRVLGSRYWFLLTNGRFLAYTLGACVGFGSIMAYGTVTPFLFQKVLGLSAQAYGELSLCLAAGLFVGSFLNTRLVARYATPTLIIIGYSITLVAGLTMLIAAELGFLNVYVIIIPMFLFVIGACLLFSNSMAGAFAGVAHMAGSAGAAYGLVQVSFAVFVTFLLSFFHIKNQLPFAVSLVLMSLFGLSVFLIVVVRTRKRQEAH